MMNYPKMINVRVDPLIYSELQRQSEETGKSTSTLVRFALCEYVNNKRRERINNEQALDKSGKKVG